MKKSPKDYVTCYCCGISIGPGFLSHTPENVGPSILCSSCHSTLEKEGFLIIDNVEKIGAFKVIRIDGNIFLIERRKINRLKLKPREEIIKSLNKL